ncbi:MAG TPA: glycine cleavage system protein GcvH [Anaerolineales bacterium]|jgi:glycine cleavage system H protein|nr:glycine cleavage system protein GcvH [Anaerolineales bacterium]
MKIDPNARYSKEHEWVRKDGELFLYGITDHAQDQLSDIVFIEFPELGDTFDSGDIIGVVESVKAAADLYMPIAGEITEVNEHLADNPEILNSDPFDEGWIVKFKPSDPKDYGNLLSAEDYEKLTGEE